MNRLTLNSEDEFCMNIRFDKSSQHHFGIFGEAEDFYKTLGETFDANQDFTVALGEIYINGEITSGFLNLKDRIFYVSFRKSVVDDSFLEPDEELQEDEEEEIDPWLLSKITLPNKRYSSSIQIIEEINVCLRALGLAECALTRTLESEKTKGKKYLLHLVGENYRVHFSDKLKRIFGHSGSDEVEKRDSFKPVNQDMILKKESLPKTLNMYCDIIKPSCFTPELGCLLESFPFDQKKSETVFIHERYERLFRYALNDRYFGNVRFYFLDEGGHKINFSKDTKIYINLIFKLMT